MAKELTVEALSENLDDVQDFINVLLEERGCGMKDVITIDIAVEEIFINIASYAYPDGTGTATVRVDFPEENRVEITFIDSGIEYNPLAKPDPDVTLPADKRPVGGLGIFMVKKSMDDVRYEYSDSRNCLTIVKGF